MDVILYSTKCPKCRVLESKLKQFNITFTEINDIDLMRSKGFISAPVLEVDGAIFNFKDAVDWINKESR